MQMGADTRENTGSWPVVHGIGVSSLFVHGRVRPTQSRPYRYLTLYGTIVERVESGDTSGRITYTSTSQMHVRSASVTLSVISIWVVGHGRFPCRFSLRSARPPRASNARRIRPSTLSGHGVDRSHGHIPAFLLPRRSLVATSNRRVTHGGRKYGGKNVAWRSVIPVRRARNGTSPDRSDQFYICFRVTWRVSKESILLLQ